MNLADNLKAAAEKFPERTAIVFYDRRIRYGELYADVCRLASALGVHGVGPGTRVALVMPNVPEFALGFYGALAAGAEVVSVNPLYTAREIGYIFRDSGVSAAIMHPFFESAVRGAVKDSPVKIIYSDSMGDPAKTDLKKLIAEEKTGRAPEPRKPDDTAFIVYTNAYRGYYLGACLTHEGLMFDAEGCRKVSATDENDSFIAAIPLYHAFSATVNLNLPISAGAKIVFHETFKEDRVIADIEKERVSTFVVVPAVLKRIFDTYGSAGKDYSFVKAFITGGAPMPLDLYIDFCAAFNAMIFEGYGITECGPVTSTNPIYKREAKPGSVGPPLEGVSVRALAEDGSVLPPGAQGELVVKGLNVMSGYLNRPEETAKFIKDGWFHTGDRAWIDADGYIFLTGLIKRMILVGGFNVYPDELEAHLMEHPAVEWCRVFGGPDELMGGKVLTEVRLRPGAAADERELRKYMRAGLAPYKTPRKIDIIEVPVDPAYI
jgi:long-chain acyl-CoA synthetase